MSATITQEIHTQNLIQNENAILSVNIARLKTEKATLAKTKREIKKLESSLQKEHTEILDGVLDDVKTGKIATEATIQIIQDAITKNKNTIKKLGKHKLANDGFRTYCIECGCVKGKDF